MQQIKARAMALARLSRTVACQQQLQQLCNSAAPTACYLLTQQQHGCQQHPQVFHRLRSILAYLLQQQHQATPQHPALQLAGRSSSSSSSSNSSLLLFGSCSNDLRQQHRQPPPPQQQQQQQQQLRHYAADDASRRRLLAAQQRRERQRELEERRLAALTGAAGTEQQQPPAYGAAPPPAAVVGDAIVPAEEHLSDVQVSRVVGHEALIVTRAIEWGTVILGFEQATKYTVYDQDGNAVALIAEEISGIGNEIQRQLLRTRRSFTSTVLSADGSAVVFRVRRPAYLINSYMYIEDAQGEVVGEVRQRWHPWRRNYDLYIGKRQFATISGGFLAWEFELKDVQGNTLALIDRNFLGFAKEIFTDAGKYVVHFGYSPQHAAQLCSRTLQVRSGQRDVEVTPLARLRTEVAVIPSITGNQLVVQHPLPLSERLIALAAAISVDYNYFSPHSQSGGFINPPLFMPIPVPGGGGGAAAGGAAAEGGAATGGAAASTAAGTEAAGAVPPGPSGPSLDQPPPSGYTGDSGFSSGLGAAQDPQAAAGFGDEGETFRWDTADSGSSSSGAGWGGDDGESGGWGGVLGGDGGDSGGGDGEGPSGMWGLLVGLWAMIFGE